MNVETPSGGGSTEYIQHHLHFLKWQFGEGDFWAIHLDTVFFTVLFCAIGVLSVLRERGVSVPGDVSVTGFDDLTYAALCSPAAT